MVSEEARAATFSTERLLLRCCSEEDAPDFLRITTDPSVAMYSSRPENGSEFTLDEIRSRILKSLADFELLLAVVLKPGSEPAASESKNRSTDRAVVGQITVREGGEIGYYIASEHHGRGYATEAVKGALELYKLLKGKNAVSAGAAPGDEYITACINPVNAASEKVLKKCGFEHWRSIEKPDWDCPEKMFVLHEYRYKLSAAL